MASVKEKTSPPHSEVTQAFEERSHGKTLRSLLIVSFLYLFAVSLLIPVFPSLIVESFNKGEGVAEESPETTARFGTLSIIKSSLDLVSLPFLGGLSDYVGRKKILLLCMLSIFIQIVLIYPPGMGVVGVDSYYTLLKISRVLSGLSDGVIVMIFASLTDLSNGDAAVLPLYYGKIGFMFGLAFTLGPMTSSILFSMTGSVAYVLLLSTLAAFVACIVSALTGETLSVTKRRQFLPQCWKDGTFWLGLTPFDQIMYLTFSPLLMAYIFTYFLHEISTAVYMSWILYFEWRFSWEITQVGIYISVVGITVGFFQGVLLQLFTARMKKWFPTTFEEKLITWPAFSSAIHFAIVGLLTQGWLMFPLLILTGFGSFMNPIMRGVVLRTQSPDKVGRVNAIFSTVGVLSTVGGNVLYPRLLKMSEEGSLVEGGINFVSSGFMLLSFLAALRAVQKYRPCDAEGGGEGRVNVEEGLGGTLKSKLRGRESDTVALRDAVL